MLVIAAAPLVAMICNSVRIAMLTLFAASPAPGSDTLFDFFHEEAGSLLFSGVAVSWIAILYLSLLHKQLLSRKTLGM
jgi:exosortase/archaeosortase family protein